MPTPCADWDLGQLLLHMEDSLEAIGEAAEVGQVAGRRPRRASRQRPHRRPHRAAGLRHPRGLAGAAHLRAGRRRRPDPRPRHPRAGRCPGDRRARLGRRPGRSAAGRGSPRTSPCGCTTSRWPSSPRRSAAAASAARSTSPRRPPPAPGCWPTSGGAEGSGLAAALARHARTAGWTAMARMRGIADRVEHLLGQAVVATTPVAGGDICTSTRVRLSDGSSALVKTRAGAPEGFFETEARGLRWLAEPGAVDVAEVLAVEHDCLVLRWVEPAKPTAETATDARPVARAAARQRGREFGADEDGFIASLPLPNKTAPTWPEFYATRAGAALPQAGRGPRTRRARRRRRPSRASIGRLTDLAGPDEPPARLHGDLWSGNIVWSDRARHPDRPGGARRSPRDRPGDARAVRRSPTCSGCSTPTRTSTRSPTAGRSASRCTSCSPCSCTPPCSAATTAHRAAEAAARL